MEGIIYFPATRQEPKPFHVLAVSPLSNNRDFFSSVVVSCFKYPMRSPTAVFEDIKSDDLEIVSIGALYIGSCDKKYWSSSRGRDRFPYPVGYRAIRAHNGNKYYMEIEESAKGPLFLIRYMDEAWAGQTPHIAWGKFQKTVFSHLKVWHGKRFACKMDGMEFFGFKNPLVQRLLRELLVNSHGMVESSSNNRTSNIQGDDGSPNLLSYLDRPMARKKRSRRTETVYEISVVNDGLKKPRPHDSYSGGEILNSASVSICSEKEVEIFGPQGIPPVKLHSSHATNENPCLPSENSPQVKLAVHIQETDQLPESYNSKPLSNFFGELQGLQEKEDKPNDDIIPNESQDMIGSNLCAPDSLDCLQDDTTSSAPNKDDDTSCKQKEELILANMVVSEVLLAEANAQALAESSLNLTSKSSDSNSADQDITESMISFLLPQAIPLLKKPSSKKPKQNDTSGTLSSKLNRSSTCTTNQLEDVSESGMLPSMRIRNADDENRKVLSPDSDQDFRSNMPIIPDSFDESQLDVHGSDLMTSSSKEIYTADVDKLPIIQEQVAIVDATLPISALEAIEGINPTSHIVSTNLDGINKDEYVKKSMSIPTCTSSSNVILSQESQELCAADGDLLQKEKHCEIKEAKSTFSSAEGNSSLVGRTRTDVGSIIKEKHKVYSRKRVSTNQQQRNKSSSSGCRNSVDDSKSKLSPIKPPQILELHPTLSSNSVSDKTNSLGDGISHTAEQHRSPDLMKVADNNFTNVSSDRACVVSQDIRPAHIFATASISPSTFPALRVEDVEAQSGEAMGTQVSEPPCTESKCNKNANKKSKSSVLDFPASFNSNLKKDLKINNEMEKIVELLGCYFHHMPVSSVFLKSAGDKIYICVLSFATEDTVRTLFLYNIASQAPTKGFPSVVGHTPIILPIADDKSGKSRILERSYLHFTPDGQYLIFPGNIKTPYCREKEFDCSCLTCSSACFEENAVRIVRVETGHVSLVTKLQAVDSVQCIVVCDPNYLIAAVKSGNLIVWVMNSKWRSLAEQFVILANPCTSSCVVELKKIPKCLHLVVGHNGIGEFTIWDISKRTLISRFASPSNFIVDFIPTSLFAWYPVHNHSTIEDHIDMILAATKLWFSKPNDNKTLVPVEVKDTAIWLLVSTDSKSDVQCDNASNNHVETPANCWRLALLARNQVILGNQLDPRTAVAGTISGHGVVGTVDGLVYMWDMSTGAKLGSLYDFKGKKVSCISRDDDSTHICIASEEGQLLVYSHLHKEAQNQRG